MYACSPRWNADWISEEDAERVLCQLAKAFRGKYPYPDHVGLNRGVHFTGGEPFLNLGLLLKLAQMASRLEIPSTFVETNCFWCRDDRSTRERLKALRASGLRGILISANPFVLEGVPFERTERAARIAEEVFGAQAMVYQRFFFDQFRSFELKGTLRFEEYMRAAGHSLAYAELLPSGRLAYKLAYLYQSYPAPHFFGESCRRELIRDWHIHVDNYCNFVPGYCGGLSLGDARSLDDICKGIELDGLPVLKALLTRMEQLCRLGRQCGYEGREGYISKCHLCLDVRLHLARQGQFQELKPVEFYEHLDDMG